MVRLLHDNDGDDSDDGVSFNPTMVRLLLFEVQSRVKLPCVVSIPQWCDCCLLSLLARNLPLRSFNPTMVRLLPSMICVGKPTPVHRFNPTMVRLLPRQNFGV